MMLVCAIVAGIVGNGDAALTLNNFVASHMVLAREPLQVRPYFSRTNLLNDCIPLV